MPILYCYVLWFEVWYCLCITMYCGMYCVMYWWYVLNTYQHVLNTKIMHSTHFHEKMMRAKTDHKLNTSHTTIQANSKETYWHVLPRPMCPNTDTGLTVSQAGVCRSFYHHDCPGTTPQVTRAPLACKKSGCKVRVQTCYRHMDCRHNWNQHNSS